MKTADDFIYSLPQDRQELGQAIREMIVSLVPGIEERLSFKLPFYHYYGMFIYLSYRQDAFCVTFCRGKDLVIAFPQLIQNNRAIAAHISIRTHQDIEATGLREIIVAAADWNEEAKRLRIPMVTKKKKN